MNIQIGDILFCKLSRNCLYVLEIRENQTSAFVFNLQANIKYIKSIIDLNWNNWQLFKVKKI